MRKISNNASFLSTSKQSFAAIDPKTLRIYGVGGKGKPNSKKIPKTKRRGNKNIHQRENTSTYEFPQFSISFIDPSRARFVNPSPPPNSIQPMEIKRDYSKQLKKQQTIQQQKHLLRCRDCYPDFIIALSKLFKQMDVFNRGSINQINVNNRVPPVALTFLGRVFKKIRQDRLTIGLKQFIKMAQPLLKQSPSQDITNFLNAFNSEEPNLKVSINVNAEAGGQRSPIKERMVQELVVQGRRSRRLEEVIDNINQKERDIRQKILMVKDKKKMVSFNLEVENNKVQSSPMKYKPQMQKQENKIERTPASNLRESNILGPKKANWQNHQETTKSNRSSDIAKFTYKLPLQTTASGPQQFHQHSYKQQLTNSKEPTTFILSQTRQSQLQNQLRYRPQQQYQQKTSKLNKQSFFPSNTGQIKISSSIYEFERQAPFTLRQTSYLRESSGRQSRSESQRQGSDRQQDKIDELNKKLEQYLRRSQSKIQKSKLFMQQNSVLNGYCR